MSDLNKILKEEYDKKKNTITTQSLMEMIEEMMNLQEAFGLVVEEEDTAEMNLQYVPLAPISELKW